MTSLPLRGLLASLQLVLGTHVPVPVPVPVPAPAPVRVLDITRAFPVELELPSRVRETISPLVTVHVTDVKGGFGVSKKSVKKWTAALLLSPGPLPGLTATELALAERYSHCAYHWLASRVLGIVRNHPPTLRTSHGNGGNRGLGFSVDCGHKEVLSDPFADTARAALLRCIEEAHEATGEVVLVVPHRVFSAGRRVDTDVEVWRKVVLPVVGTLGPQVCRIDYEMAEGGGRPVPRSWDDQALFDDAGRRLKGVS